MTAFKDMHSVLLVTEQTICGHHTLYSIPRVNKP